MDGRGGGWGVSSSHVGRGPCSVLPLSPAVLRLGFLLRLLLLCVYNICVNACPRAHMWRSETSLWYRLSPSSHGPRDQAQTASQAWWALELQLSVVWGWGSPGSSRYTYFLLGVGYSLLNHEYSLRPMLFPRNFSTWVSITGVFLLPVTLCIRPHLCSYLEHSVKHVYVHGHMYVYATLHVCDEIQRAWGQPHPHSPPSLPRLHKIAECSFHFPFGV